MSIPLDGSPLTVDAPRAIESSYWSGACITSQSGQELDVPRYMNHNAFFDSARRFSQFVRFIDRPQITGYEVVNGKSVIYVTLRDLGGGATVLDGIKDAITATAPKEGWSNEWLLLPYFRPYSPHDTHTLSLPNFADYYDIWQRGQWHAPETEVDEDLLWQISYGAKVNGYGNFLAESVSGYNYAKLYTPTFGSYNLNYYPHGGDPTEQAKNLKFYKSVQIYKPPYEIESAETVNIDGAERIRITLTTRLQNTVGEVDGVPAGDISRDVSTWVGATIAAEPYRTDENALRLYLVWLATGYNPPCTIGDWARAGEPNTHYDSLFASIMPTLVLVKLMPLPYDDGNDTAQSSDSPAWHDWFLSAEWYIRAMCEGYVDESSSIRLACNATDPDGEPETGDETCLTTGSDIYDYTFESLMVDASGGTRSSMLTVPTTDLADPWPSYGPLPRTPRSAEVFNLYSAAVNKLTRVRLMIPYALYSNTTTYQSDPDVVAAPNDVCNGAYQSCGANTGRIVYSGQGNPATTFVSETGWGSGWGQLEAHTSAAIALASCSGADYLLETDRTTCDFEFRLVDDDFEYAMPDQWKELWTGGNVGTMFCVYRLDKDVRWTDELTTECDSPLEWDCGMEVATRESVACQFLKAGFVDFGSSPPAGLHASAWSYAGTPVSCQWGPLRQWYAYPVENRTLFLEVPLEGEEEATDIEPEDLTE